MNGLIRSPEVSRIVKALADLPGSQEMNVISKRFPRLGPAESHTTYEEQRNSFRANEAPPAVPLPPEFDELIIVLTGAVVQKGPGDTGWLLDDVEKRLGLAHIGADWDVRAHFSPAGQELREYELMVFTNSCPAQGVFFD